VSYAINGHRRDLDEVGEKHIFLEPFLFCMVSYYINEFEGLL